MAQTPRPTKRLYKCDACGATRYVQWKEFNRAAKPRCMACGCTRLELVTAEGKKALAALQRQRVQGTHGSLKLDSSLEGKHVS